MKIAMLTSDYLPNIGGIASHIYELSKALVANGHEVEIWYWDRKGLKPSKMEMGEVPVRILPVDISPGKFKRNLVKNLARGIEKCLHEFNADVLHLHTLDQLMPGLRYVSRQYPGKIVWTNHSSRFLRKSNSVFWRLKTRLHARVIDGLIAPSKELLERSAFLGLSSQNAEYIANGVDIDKFNILPKEEVRGKLGLPENRFILLSTRRFSPKNGIRYLALAMVKVVEVIPEALCVFCGNLPDAKDWPVVQKIVKDNGLEDFVRFEGAISNSDINSYLNAADIVILPSLMEATSISGLEGMAAGKPLVGTYVGGIPELIDDGVSGFLVEPGSPDALSDGIIKAYSALDLETAGKVARKKVEKEYTWEKVAKTVFEFYQRL